VSTLGITTSETIVQRRTKLLKLEGEGYDRADITKLLSQEFQVSERTLSRDFQLRHEWQPQLTSMTDRVQAYHSILNRFDQVYKKASFKYQHAHNENVQIAALKIMLDSLSRIKELANVSAAQGDSTNEIELSWKKDTTPLYVKTNDAWNGWVNDNCTQEDKRTIDAMTKLWIRFEYDINPKLSRGDSIH